MKNSLILNRDQKMLGARLTSLEHRLYNDTLGNFVVRGHDDTVILTRKHGP